MNQKTTKMLRRSAEATKTPYPKGWRFPLEGMVAKNPRRRYQRMVASEWKHLSHEEKASYRRDVLRARAHKRRHLGHVRDDALTHLSHDFIAPKNRAERRAKAYFEGVFAQKHAEAERKAKAQAAKDRKIASAREKRARRKSEVKIGLDGSVEVQPKAE